MIHLKKETLIDKVLNYDVVLVPMGINNSFNSGFCYEIGLNFPEIVKIENENSPYGDKRKYGTIFPVRDGGTVFCMCYIHNGGYRRGDDGSYLRVDSLKSCLSRVISKYGNKRIASPVLGSTKFDGNYDKSQIIRIFDSMFGNTDIDLYDYEQQDYKHEIFKEIAELHELSVSRKISGADYDKKRSEIEWRRRNGIFKPMPEDYVYKPKQLEEEKLIRFSKTFCKTEK